MGAGILLAWASVTGSSAPAATPAGLRVWVLDVGEGQAVLLQRGDRGVLLDVGHPGMAHRILEVLAARGVAQLDYMVLTHLHPDHAGGYFRLREAFPEVTVVESGHRPPPLAMPDTSRWVAEALDRERRRLVVRAGDVLRWEGAELEILWPPEPSGSNLNRMSLVVMARYGRARILVMGDADAQVEGRLLSDGKVDGRISVLVVGHHGARDASSVPFLRLLRPRMAVVSVNAGNLRGYPAPEVLERLARWAGRVLRTDRDGDICLELGRQAPDPRLCAAGEADPRGGRPGAGGDAV